MASLNACSQASGFLFIWRDRHTCAGLNVIIFTQILVDAQSEAGHVKAGFLSAESSLDKDIFLGPSWSWGPTYLAKCFPCFSLPNGPQY